MSSSEVIQSTGMYSDSSLKVPEACFLILAISYGRTSGLELSFSPVQYCTQVLPYPLTTLNHIMHILGSDHA